MDPNADTNILTEIRFTSLYSKHRFNTRNTTQLVWEITGAVGLQHGRNGVNDSDGTFEPEILMGESNGLLAGGGFSLTRRGTMCTK